MALAAEYWATDGGAGTKTGLSLANAAGIDPNAANDLWTIINGDTVVSDIRINLCADSAVTVGATIEITKDATSTYHIDVHGRNAADSADAEVTLDAGGGNYSVILLTTADYWGWFDIHATNTNRTGGFNAWTIGVNADVNVFVRCRASFAYHGFDTPSTSVWHFLIGCRAHNNALTGFTMDASGTGLVNCISHNNGTHGFQGDAMTTYVRCLSYNNSSNGFYGGRCSQCIAYDNGSVGFWSTGFFPIFIVDCISVDNSYGYGMVGTNYNIYLLRCADYNNPSGRVDLNGGTLYGDDDDPGLSADPFVEPGPKYTLAAGAAGATSTDNGGDSNIEDLNNGSWGGSVSVGDRIRFFNASTSDEDALETVVTAVSVGADDDIITVSPQVTAATQKQCWLGGGNFALNASANGGIKCRNTDGTATVDSWSTDYLDIGAVQHLAAAGGGGGLLVHPGTSGGARG